MSDSVQRVRTWTSDKPSLMTPTGSRALILNTMNDATTSTMVRPAMRPALPERDVLHFTHVPDCRKYLFASAHTVTLGVSVLVTWLATRTAAAATTVAAELVLTVAT